MDGLDPGKLLAMICDRCNISRDKIGRIDLKGAYSFFEVDKNFTGVVKDHIHGFEYKGRMVRIEVTDSRDSGPRRSSSSSSSSSRTYGGGRDERKQGGRDRDRKRSGRY
jgi:ATP-dependent RNA helicase DeaD